MQSISSPPKDGKELSILITEWGTVCAGRTNPPTAWLIEVHRLLVKATREYNKRGEQRDKLLKYVKEVKQDIRDNMAELEVSDALARVSELINECEGK